MQRRVALTIMLAVLVSSLGCVYDLPPLPSTDIDPQYAVSALQIVSYFASKGMPISNPVIYDETTDPNQRLGRPGQYTSKVNFDDQRIMGSGGSAAAGYVPPNTVEVFKSEAGMKLRYNQLKSLESGELEQYIYASGAVILRLHFDMLPADAKEYEALLGDIELHYGEIVRAPEIFPAAVIDAPMPAAEKEKEEAGELTDVVEYSGIRFAVPRRFDVDMDSHQLTVTMIPNESFISIIVSPMENITNEELIETPAFSETIYNEYVGIFETYKEIKKDIAVIGGQRALHAKLVGRIKNIDAGELCADIYTFIRNKQLFLMLCATKIPADEAILTATGDMLESMEFYDLPAPAIGREIAI